MALFSTYWYRVADIKPQLRSHVRLTRHTYRGNNWYVLVDPSASRQHRFNRAAYTIIGMMDGKRSVQEIWKSATAEFGDDAPTQDEIIRLLGQLHAADVLQSDIPPDIVELFERQDRHRNRWKQRLMNPFALRFPLLDPDRFLVKWLFLARPMVGRTALVVWLFVVTSGVILAALNWPELTRNIADRVLKPENLLLLWLVYPVIKLLHELGHAFATRLWGGEVHEMGIMLLAMTPIPYVEASASAAFPEKGRRMGVAAAGMAVEVFVASLALLLWLNVEPGRVSAIAYNVMLIGGVSTLLFNGNPLLRYDGYYVLSDWIEIPNLAQRSTRYLGYLLQHYLFGVDDAVSPVTAPGERAWFLCYGIAAFFYRIFILAVLTLLVSSKFFIVGVLIGFWAIATQVVVPVIRSMYNFYTSPGGRKNRTRFITASLLGTTLLALLLFAVPAPYATRAQGVVTLPEHSWVRAGTDCFITGVLQPNNSMVEQDSPLLRCEAPYLDAEVKLLEASLKEIQAQYKAESIDSRTQREILKEDIATVEADLARARERINELTILSPKSGLFILPEADKLPGRYIRQGDLLGYIMGTADSTVVVVVDQSEIALIREQTRQVELRLAGQLAKVYKTTIDRQVPAASDVLPSPVLGTVGGGPIPVNPQDARGIKTLTQIFQLELKLPLSQGNIRIGERVYALFDHGYEPLGLQWLRSLRQLFLSHFHV